MKFLFGLLAAAAVVWLVLVVPFTGAHIHIGAGEHTGYVTAVEKTGIFFKTGTAYIKTDVSSSQEDSYCVTDPAVYAQLQQASESRQKITVQFFSWMISGAAHCNGESAVINAVR